MKEFVANRMLAVGLSNGSIQKTMVALRKLFRFLVQRHGANLSPIGLNRYDALALQDYFCQTETSKAHEGLAIVARFAAFLREQYNDQPDDFRPNPLAAPRVRDTKRSFSEGLEQVIPDEVSSAIMEAVGKHQISLERNARESASRHLHSHQIYLAVLILLFFSGRRISEVLLLRQECLREPFSDELVEIGERGVWLVFHNTKVGLGQQEIFITEPAADLVRKMVERVRILTENLATASELDRMFLFSSTKASRDPTNIRGVNAKAFSNWLNGRVTEEGRILRAGFVHRYRIRYQGEYYYVNPHQMRHTLAYKAYLGGASYVDVGDHLQHKRTANGLSPMTGVYIHGQEKDVQHLKEMHTHRKVVGKAVPLINDRLVVVNNLNLVDVAIWRDQGMILQPTHYGHCILPEESGPCVCGDPCWIGPQGDGCDYALYTLDSRNALLADRALLLQQVEALEHSNPKRPRLGQWKARLDRLDQVLKEIAEAEVRMDNGETPDRPRAQLVPQDPPFETLSPQPQVKRSMRARRQEAARSSAHGAFRRKYDLEKNKELDANTIKLANTLLKDIEVKGIPMSIKAFALRLHVDANTLYNCVDVYDRLLHHNEQCRIPLQEIMVVKLDELYAQEKIMWHEEFADWCGISRGHFFKSYPEWSNKLSEQNKQICKNQVRRAIEQRLQELVVSRTGQSIVDFSRQIGVDPKTLRTQHADVVRALVRHNKAINLPGAQGDSSKEEKVAFIYDCWKRANEAGACLTLTQLAEQCHFLPRTIRYLCPELVRQCYDEEEERHRHVEETLAKIFAEIEQSNEEKSAKYLAAKVGIAEMTLHSSYHHWKTRLYEHNKKVTSSRLQATWDRMESLKETWSFIRFAKEAEISFKTLKNNYEYWAERLQAKHSDKSEIRETQRPLIPTAERIYALIENAKHSSILVTPAELAKEVGITYSTLIRHHSDLYVSLVEYNKIAFKPAVEAAWRKICELDLYPTLSEFAAMCGFRHFSILLAYFPDSAQQVRDRSKPKE